MTLFDIDVDIAVDSTDCDGRRDRDLSSSGVSLTNKGDKYPTSDLGEQIGYALLKTQAPRKASVIAAAAETVLTFDEGYCPNERIKDAEEMLATAAREVLDAWQEHDEDYATETVFASDVLDIDYACLGGVC